MFGKNMYNALYTMDMPDVSSMENCRSYAGIQEAGGDVVLKYYDNVKYIISDADENGIAYATEDKAARHRLEYDKIEYLKPMQWSSGTAKHKSNLFSVKIYSTGLDDASI